MSLYVGRYVDPGTMVPGGEYAVLEADALTRHAVCLGMTGSGKTGLCVALLEELAMAGVPVVIIDPKGDMANLALAFREHRAEDFAPWVDPAAAKREGLSVDDYAAKLADRWRKGLAEWQVTPDRIDAFVNGAEVTVYTPGSTTGVAVDVLNSLGQPPEGIDEEGLLELVVGTVSGLLALVGVEADPLTDPAHLVLSGILEGAWRAGESLDLAGLITRLVDPPFDKVGVFPLERFYPRNDRMKLAMQLNGLVASPAFAPWAQGVPLDPERFLARGDKTPISVFYLAHLDEPRRMFFTSLLLDRIVAWSRRQPGTSSLRALVYFDEVYGYLPPYPKNPPTKKPVLTLMKQARAVGVGTMLVTQNPVDVDYAALANAGLWLIGRLQTEQDREKVVDGLAGAGGDVDRRALGDWIARLPSRTFVVREAGAPEPRLLHSRQVVSFLRGPLTRREIEQLRGPETSAPPPPPRPGTSRTTVAGAGAVAAGAGAVAAGAGGVAAGVSPAGSVPPGWTTAPPPAPQGYAYRYLDPRVVFSARLQPFFDAHARPRREDGRTEWQPAVYARLQLQFDEGRDFLLHRDEHRLFFPIDAAPVEPDFQPGDLLGAAPGEGLFAPLPPHVDEARELKAFEKRVVDEVLRGETERMFRHRGLRLDSRAGEAEMAFAERVATALDDEADEEIAKLKDRVEREVKRLQDRRTRLARDVDKHKADARNRQVQEVVSAGETLLGLFFGRRRATTAVSSAVSRRNQTSAAQQRAETAEAEIGQLERDEYELEVKTQEEIEAIRAKWAAQLRDIEAVDVRLDRTDLQLTDFGIVWVPVTRPI